MPRKLGYCEASGKQTATTGGRRAFCGECHDPAVLVNDDGKLRKHFRLWSKEELIAKGFHHA